MRFWVSKNGELPVREQLVRQVLLGILSEDLPAGHKLPSVRAVARRHRIHANTVSAAYHELLERGWLELRRGSGLYVRPMNSSNAEQGELDGLLAVTLQEAKRRGYEPEEVLRRLDYMVRPLAYERIVIAEPDPAMREILVAELKDHLNLPVETMDISAAPTRSDLAHCLIVALPTRAANARHYLPRAIHCMALRLSSVNKALEAQTKPSSEMVISIVSRSAEIRYWARAMLIAVGLDPECLCEIDATSEAWRDRLTAGTLVVTDIVSAGQLPPGCLVKVFRVIAESSILELQQYCSR